MGGAGSAHFSYGDLLWEGPCSTRRESDLRREGWIRRSTALGVCVVQASSLTGTGSLWDFGWGMGGGDGPGKRLCSSPSCVLSSGVNNSPCRCPPASRSPAKLLPYNLPDVKSRLLSGHTPSGPSTFASQTWGLCFAGRLPLRPNSLPPVRVVNTASPPFLPSSMGLSSMLGSGESVLPVSWQFSGLFRQVWVESK